MTKKTSTKNYSFTKKIQEHKKISGLIVLLSSFCFLTYLVNSGITQGFDTTVTYVLSNSLNQVSFSLIRYITALGSTKILGLATLITTITFLLYKRKKSAVMFFSLLVSTSLTCTGLKLLFARPRPAFSVFSFSANGFSYPSGHTMGAFSFFIGLYLFAVLKEKNSYNLYLLALVSIISLLVGLSRIFLAVHYPTDVIGGYLASGILLVSFSLIYDKIKQIFQ